jgi:ankyrin repeat protein
LINQIVLSCEDGQLEFSIIDAPDEEGYTPLHYACILRLPVIMKLLHGASADVNVPDKKGWTPIHWAAMQLDEVALGILTAHSFDVDMKDDEGRSPLFLACVEGRDRSGKHNSDALLACMRKLLSLNAETVTTDKNGVPLLHYLAASWKFEALELLLEHKVEVLTVEAVNGKAALHHACKGCPIDPFTGQSTGPHDVGGTGGAAGAVAVLVGSSVFSDPSAGINTLVALLRAGGRPNGRDMRGKSPLQVLAENASVWGNMIHEAVKMLISYGARFDDSSATATLKAKILDAEIQELIELRATAPVIEADDLGIRYQRLS